MIGENLIDTLTHRVNVCAENIERLEDEANTEDTVDGENIDYWQGALSSASWCLDIARKHVSGGNTGCMYNHDHAAEPEKCEWHN